MKRTVNVLLDTFPGLSLPSTVCLPCSASLTTDELLSQIYNLLPAGFPSTTRLLVTSTANQQICRSSTTTVEDLVKNASASSSEDDNILSLRLSVPLCGGKGGFGSQLRAAGGRMSTRKKRQNAELAHGSARNLDGRRLRTVTEAKNLATYLATKPEMDRKEREEKRKRWEAVIELAEQREADMRAGKTADGRRKGLSDEWMVEKEEVGENVKNAVKKAMLAAEQADVAAESSGSGGSGNGSEQDDSDEEDVMELDDEEMSRLKAEAEVGDVDALWVLKNQLKIPTQYLPQQKQKRYFAGFDDEEDDEDAASEEEEFSKESSNKGKAKIVS